MSERRTDEGGILADNVRRRRENLGWTRKRLCAEAGVSPQTLKAVEDGEGCTLGVEHKLAKAFRTVPGRLWEPLSRGLRQVHRRDEDRWYFAEVAEGTRYHERSLAREDLLRMDPDTIQAAPERARLGNAGLSQGFVRVTTAHLGGRSLLSSEIEVYGEMGTNAPDGWTMHVHVLSGEILFYTDGTSDVLGEGDVLQAVIRAPSWIKPARAIAPGDAAPRVAIVDLGASF